MMSLLAHFVFYFGIVFYSTIGLTYAYQVWILGRPFKEVDEALYKIFF